MASSHPNYDSALEQLFAELPQGDVPDAMPVRAVGMPEDELARLYAGVAAQTVDKEATLRDRLRELPTHTRVAAATSGMALIAVGMLVSQPVRPDLATEGVRLFINLSALAGLGFLSTALALRSHHKVSLGPTAWGLALAAAVLPALSALVPGLWPGMPMPEGAGFAAHLGCGMWGALGAAGMVAVLWLFDREDSPSAPRLLAASAGGGAVAMAVEGAHCMANDTVHVAFAHGSYAVAVFAVAWVALSLRRLLTGR